MMRALWDALTARARALGNEARGGARLATLALSVWAGAAAPSAAAPQSRVNINVTVQGIGGITDLTASPGASNGLIDLTWTEPFQAGTTGPHSYDIRASTTGQIPDHAAFLAAQPLTAFTPTAIPAPGPGGGQVGVTLSGLVPGLVHYFAIRELDSAGRFGAWVRSGARNQNNFANAQFSEPIPVTNLSALAGPGEGQVTLTWTAPLPPVLIEHRVYSATFSVADVGGSTTAWYAAAGVSVKPAAAPPGGDESLTLNLNPGERYWFGLKSVNNAGVGQPDALSTAGPQASERAMGVEAVKNLTALPGPGSGVVRLSWNEPGISSVTAPIVYQMRVSTLGFINGATDFAAAPDLSAFSTVTAPSYAAAGAPRQFDVTGLQPQVTYYFALRAVDASTPTFAGAWLRVPAQARNLNTGTRPSLIFNAPDSITDLSALPGAAEGDVALSWTAPRNQNQVPIASYEVRFATVPVTAFGGSTTAWSAAASSQAFSPAAAPGSLESFGLSGLYPAATWYFGVKSVDVLGEESYLDALTTAPVQARTLPRNFAPAAVAGLSAVAGLRRATLSWTDLSAAQRGLDFRHYRVERSTSLPDFSPVSTTTATGLLDFPVSAGVTYYYRVASVDFGGYESLTSTVSALPFAPSPMEPLGLSVVSNSTSTTLSWSPVTRYDDGTPFVSTAAPVADELQGYRVMRSTTACAQSFVQLSTMNFSSTTLTDASMGLNYLYRVYSFNTQGISANPVTLSALGDRGFYLDDCDSGMVMDATVAPLLSAATNGLGGDVRIVATRRPQDVGGAVFQSAEWKAYLNGVSELRNFAWPKPVRLTLRFETDGAGAPVPSTSAYAPSAAPAAGAAAASSAHLGMYWYNGGEFKKMYGRVDQNAQTVSIETPNLGVYQIRSLLRPGGAVFDLSNISGRVITPNGDGLNDVVIFTYDPGLANARAEGRIYDVQGRHVADMTPGLVPNTLTWDGRMNGRPASGGVYVYRITGDGKTFTGTVVVAK
jgi:hypothetical protein